MKEMQILPVVKYHFPFQVSKENHNCVEDNAEARIFFFSTDVCEMVETFQRVIWQHESKALKM